MSNFQHQPVLLEETIELLIHNEEGIYVDCTVGGGGHSEAILQKCPRCRLLCVDQDQEALAASATRLAPYGDRVLFVWDNFKNIDEILAKNNIDKVDGFLMDLGVSSYQLDEAQRGFSYQQDAPLDMRMNREGAVTARDLVNNLPEEELAQIIMKYGEERWAARIAKFIAEARTTAPIETTGELVDIVKKAVPKKARAEGPHPAKRTFQALRIAVNDELRIIEPAISKAAEHLNVGGRIAVISFHSLEDRIVKETFRYLNKECICLPGQAVCTCDKVRMTKNVNKKPIVASEAELSANPRARSAKLRVAERV